MFSVEPSKCRINLLGKYCVSVSKWKYFICTWKMNLQVFLDFKGVLLSKFIWISISEQKENFMDTCA